MKCDPKVARVWDGLFPRHGDRLARLKGCDTIWNPHLAGNAAMLVFLTNTPLRINPGLRVGQMNVGISNASTQREKSSCNKGGSHSSMVA